MGDAIGHLVLEATIVFPLSHIGQDDFKAIVREELSAHLYMRPILVDDVSCGARSGTWVSLLVGYKRLDLVKLRVVEDALVDDKGRGVDEGVEILYEVAIGIDKLALRTKERDASVGASEVLYELLALDLVAGIALFEHLKDLLELLS